MAEQTDSIAGQLLPRLQRDLAEGTTPWLAFFAHIVESGFVTTFAGMTRTPTSEQIACWLKTIPGFPQLKIDARMTRIQNWVAKGVPGAVTIAGDFQDWILSLGEPPPKQ